MGPLIAERDADDRCLTDPGKGEKPTLEPCSKAVKDRLNIHWDFKLVSRMLLFLFKIAILTYSLRAGP